MNITHPALTNLRIIGLAGRKGVGKDAAANYLALRGWKRIALATPMKLAVAENDSDILKCNQQPRQIWQQVGTEIGRTIDPELWIELLLARMVAGYKFRGVARWAVSDVRFPNEAEAIQQWGGKVIEVRRTAADATDTHASETSVAQIKADWIIPNDGTIPELCAQLKAALKELDYA